MLFIHHFNFNFSIGTNILQFELNSQLPMKSTEILDFNHNQNFSKAEMETDLGRQKQTSTISKFSTDGIEREINTLINRNKPVMIGKLVALFLFMTIGFLQSRKFKTQKQSVDCLHDRIFDLTESLNHKMNTDPTFRGTLQITSSMLVDFASITMICYYFKNGVMLTYPFQLLVFYVIRGVVQGNFLFRHPEGTVWGFPGIPSLTVPYGIMSDYYFSGHCGFVTLVAMEMYKLGYKWTSYFVGLSTLYIGFVLIVARVHYSIDIPIGIIVAVFSSLMVSKYIKHIQYFLRRLLNKRVWLKIKWFAEI